MSLQFDDRESKALKKYLRMKKVGATPHIVYRVMSYDGFWGWPCMKMMRTLFPELGLGDVKEVMIEVDSGMPADQYYELILIPDIEAALDQMDKEKNAPPS